MLGRHMLGKFAMMLRIQGDDRADWWLADSTLGESWNCRQRSGGVCCTM
jgi:hypothetical protein